MAEYFSRIAGLVRELQCAGNDVLDQNKIALSRDLPKGFDVTVHSIMPSLHPCAEAVSRLIVKTTRVQKKDEKVLIR